VQANAAQSHRSELFFQIQKADIAMSSHGVCHADEVSALSCRRWLAEAGIVLPCVFVYLNMLLRSLRHVLLQLPAVMSQVAG
jgi:hypothetical protein